jgi:folate-binding protein YgfZ
MTWPDVDSYGNVTAEYLGLRERAGLVRGRLAIVWAEGPDAIGFLDGQLSQDIAAIGSGSVGRSRVGLVADRDRVEVVHRDLEKYRFRVDVALSIGEDEVLELLGPGAAGVLQDAGIAAPEGWSAVGGVTVARIPFGGLPRYLVAGVAPDVLEGAGAEWAGHLASEAVRIEAGEPVVGRDLDESTIPHETGLVTDSVSFTKGCYLGQELVARIDSRGHVNRALRAVVMTSNVLPPAGAELVAAGREVGTLTSVAESLTLRAPVGLALVRREADPGSMVDVRWDGGNVTGRIEELPLDDFAPA